MSSSVSLPQKPAERRTDARITGPSLLQRLSIFLIRYSITIHPQNVSVDLAKDTLCYITIIYTICIVNTELLCFFGNLLFTERGNKIRLNYLKNNAIISAKNRCNSLWDNDLAFCLPNGQDAVPWTVKYKVKALHIGDYIGQIVKLVGWPVTQKDVFTKDGLSMCFLSLEDETAMYETVVFPQVYDKYNRLLFDQIPLFVYGRVVNDQGAISVEINRIEVLGKKIIREPLNYDIRKK